MSAAIAALFGTHGQAYQVRGAQAVAFQEQFVQLLGPGASTYANAEPVGIVGDTGQRIKTGP